MTLHRRLWVVLLLLFVLVLAACSSAGPSAPATDTPAVQPTQPPASPTAVPAVETEPVMASPTPSQPTLACTPPPCDSGGVLACTDPAGCPGGCGTVCVKPTDTPAPLGGDPIPHLQVGLPITLTTLQMFDPALGWAVGKGGAAGDDHVLHTADGAHTWQDVTPPQPLDAAATLGQAAAAFFLTPYHAWVVYYDLAGMPVSAPVVIWSTHDGGESWQQSAPLELPATGDFYQISDLQFVDTETGWALMHLGVGMSHDYVALYQTLDGGLTWKKLLDPDADAGLPMSCGKTGFGFLSAQTGWVLGDCAGVVPGGPYVYQTNNGGQAWQLVSLPAPADVPQLFDPNSSDYACGASGIKLFSATDGALLVRCMVFTDSSQKGWVYTTRDGGQTWTSNSLPATLTTVGYGQNPVFWRDAAQGWALLDSRPQGGALYATIDGGATWTLVKRLNWLGTLDWVDAQNGWALAVSPDGTALVFTVDGGQKWNQIAPQVAP